MTDADRDPMLDRVISELRTLPPLDRDAVARIVAAAASARVSAADGDELMPAPGLRRPVRWSWAIGIAAAAGLAGFLARGAWMSPRPADPLPSPRAVGGPAVPVRAAADVDADARPVPKQFVLDNPTARRVALVGDFNNWNASATPLARDPVSGLWTTVVSIAPGRHVYGYLVDDSMLTLDPRAPKTKDPALGVEGSVVIVGKP